MEHQIYVNQKQSIALGLWSASVCMHVTQTVQDTLVLYPQCTLRSCERQKEGPERKQEDCIRMLFVAGKNIPAYMGFLDSLHWIDVKSINGGRHQVGFDPEVHKVNGTLALCLWFSQFCPLLSVCFVFTLTSLIVTRRLPTFYFASWIERGTKSSYNHGKYLGFILNPSEFCACPHCDHLGVRPVADISLAASKKSWFESLGGNQPAMIPTEPTHLDSSRSDQLSVSSQVPWSSWKRKDTWQSLNQHLASLEHELSIHGSESTRCGLF